ncbi:MAG TPA: bifunctional [glutamate--ammonia ligase]-adenylyl-L-tyrosine phosphorylase/[glutamate--ammonia-ligase] adenylyltransferase [Myxococcales bacterium]|jgi:glutamate-ammonia-ligase adenylyltransferase
MDERTYQTAVTLLADQSPALWRRVQKRPRLLAWLRSGDHLLLPKPLERYRREIFRKLRWVAPGDLAALMRALRQYRGRESVRLAARQLASLATVPETSAEMARLAEACLHGALGALAPSPACEGFCVLGMGKLGGGELNFSSDVDLVFVHADGADGVRWTRVAERLVKVIGEPTNEGVAFRVDMGLRPEGRGGPLVVSAEAMERYYESFGRTWERAALLKARPVAGDLPLGARVLASLEPFVWRRSVDAAAIEEMRSLKRRVEERAVARGDDVKLGPGGIREVEFFVQALQLLHGGRLAAMRERSTLGALRHALVAGLVSVPDHDALAGAYLFLRRVEDRLQMAEELRTHRLPEDPAALDRLAKGLGFAGVEAFRAELQAHRARVGSIFSDLLHVSGVRPSPPDASLALACDPDALPGRRAEALARKGFADPAAALATLERLARRPGSPFGRRGAAPPLALSLLAGCSASPDPDLALLHLGELFAPLRAPAAFHELLDRNPPTVRLLTTLFGTSDFLSKEFIRHPELLDSLVRSDAAAVRRSRAELAAILAERVDPAQPAERRLGALRRFKGEEVLRIGLHDVAGDLEVEEVLEELTALADVLVGECLRIAWEPVVERWGRPRSRFAVVGLGSLGGSELGYHSDVDLLFVYEGPGESEGGRSGHGSHAELFSRLAQRLLSNLSMQLGEGVLYRTDVRLRPSGNEGMLVVSLPSLSSHHERSEPWERQALTRARFVAGDASLFERVDREVLQPLVLRPVSDPRALAAEIARVRGRMESELSGERGGRPNPKLGRGGLADIEFCAQYLQLVHRLREPNTLRALRALRAAGALPQSEAAVLERAWRFLRRLELALRIVHDFPLQQLPEPGRALDALARRMGGYSGSRPGERLREDYDAATSEVRGAYEHILGA